jgi:hypothetical protein
MQMEPPTTLDRHAPLIEQVAGHNQVSASVPAKYYCQRGRTIENPPAALLVLPAKSGYNYRPVIMITERETLSVPTARVARIRILVRSMSDACMAMSYLSIKSTSMSGVTYATSAQSMPGARIYVPFQYG